MFTSAPCPLFTTPKFVTILSESIIAQPKNPEIYNKQELKETCLEQLLCVGVPVFFKYLNKGCMENIRRQQIFIYQ
jgi:hypothetical protein